MVRRPSDKPSELFTMRECRYGDELALAVDAPEALESLPDDAIATTGDGGEVPWQGCACAFELVPSVGVHSSTTIPMRKR